MPYMATAVQHMAIRLHSEAPEARDRDDNCLVIAMATTEYTWYSCLQCASATRILRHDWPNFCRIWTSGPISHRDEATKSRPCATHFPLVASILGIFPPLLSLSFPSPPPPLPLLPLNTVFHTPSVLSRTHTKQDNIILHAAWLYLVPSLTKNLPPYHKRHKQTEIRRQ